jgi:hypothetical protein
MPRAAVNVEGTKRALAALAVGIQGAAWASLAEAMSDAERSGKLAIEAKTQTRTGRLLREVDRYRIPQGLQGHLVWRAPYAGYIDEGTKPHLIRARNAQTLAFRAGGQTIFRRAVNHPGTQPRPFKALAMASGQMSLRDGLTRRVNDLAAKF